MIRPATEDEYFRGHKADKPHPHMPATGTEGLCELCGGDSKYVLHVSSNAQDAG